MSRLNCFALLVSLFLTSPSQADQIPTEIQSCPTYQTYSVRMPGMSSFDFMKAADLMILETAPEWYVEGTAKIPIVMHSSINILDTYGRTWKDEQGVFHVSIDRIGLMLSTVEDLASVILHEYVHVIRWDRIEDHDWSDNCKEARQELMANKIVIENYNLLEYTPYMLENSYILYADARALALLNQCPAEVMSDLPEIPIPIPASSIK